MRGFKFRGRPPILIADSVKNVANLSNPYAAIIMDRGSVIDEDFVDAIVAQSVMGWEGRNPSPALDEDGNFQGTDLDLLSFLVPLAERNGVIEFPQYRSHRASKLRHNERRVGTPCRFGQATGMTSNQQFFNFSIRIIDNTVIVSDPTTGKEKSGAFRNFMIVGPEGRWHGGWHQIVFNPTAAENDFLTAKDLWTKNTVYFKNAVHPNRWQSLFGAPYLLLKILHERFSEEYRHYGVIVKELKDKGYTLPLGEISHSGPSEDSGVQEERRTFLGMEVLLDLPKMAGSFPEVPSSNEGLLTAHRRAKSIRYTLNSTLKCTTPDF